jgi:hypothetical protein
MIAISSMAKFLHDLAQAIRQGRQVAKVGDVTYRRSIPSARTTFRQTDTYNSSSFGSVEENGEVPCQY